MKFVIVAAALVVLSGPAFADDQTVFLGRALAALQAQRNAAADQAVNALARAEMLQEQLKAVSAELARAKEDLAKSKETKEPPQ